MERGELLKKLKQEIPFQWRVQSFNKKKAEATCVAYIDARDAMNLLDTYCDEGWQKDYKEVKGNMFCGIGIKINGEWEWRWDCGTESQTEKEKGEASDSFKRAAVNWGIGRFLYDKEIARVPANEIKTDKNYPYVVDSRGKQVWDLSEHINSGKWRRSDNSGEPPLTQAKQPEPLSNEVLLLIETATLPDHLTNIWRDYKPLQSDPKFVELVRKKKEEITNLNSQKNN